MQNTYSLAFRSKCVTGGEEIFIVDLHASILEDHSSTTIDQLLINVILFNIIIIVQSKLIPSSI